MLRLDQLRDGPVTLGCRLHACRIRDVAVTLGDDTQAVGRRHSFGCVHRTDAERDAAADGRGSDAECDDQRDDHVILGAPR